jgi:hypothetical protein
LIPEQSAFEQGGSPQSGTYKISGTPMGLAFFLDFIDFRGVERHIEFRLDWDRDTPASLELVDARTLNTTIEKDDLVVAHASRVLSEDGTRMEITERGFTPEGKPFINRAAYSRG